MRILPFLVLMSLSGAALAQTAVQPRVPATTVPGAPPAGFTAPPQAGTLTPPAAPAAPVIADVSSVTVTKTAKADRDVFIGAYITIDKTCKIGATPTIEFTQQPANGKIRTRRDAINLQHAPGVPRSKCLGVSPAGIAVVYRSKPRMKGDDTFAYKAIYPDGRVREVSGTVTVQ